LCIGGGAAVCLGSLLPFISGSSSLGDATFNINGGGRLLSVIFGAVIVVIGLLARRRLTAARTRPGPSTGPAVTLTVLSSLGVLGYSGFAAAGIVGFQDQDDMGFPGKVTYSPNIGLVLCILGCAVAGVGAIRLLTSATPARRRAW
jgi:peptidoglycan/LPS O-acetylase OafA/YrhL